MAPTYVNGVDSNYTKTGAVEVKVDAVETHAHSTETKVDTVDTNVDSALAEVIEIDGHIHSSNKVYGKASAEPYTLARKTTTPMTVASGGAAAAGNRYLLFAGDTAIIPDSYFDPARIQVVSVETANSPTIFEFYTGTLGTGVSITGTSAGNDTISASGHGLSVGELVIFTSLSSDAAGLERHFVYYVSDVSGADFKVELLSGSGTVDITADAVTGTLKRVTAETLVSECIISAANTSSDAFQLEVQSPRISTAKAWWVRATNAAGDKDTSFFVDLHTYSV